MDRTPASDVMNPRFLRPLAMNAASDMTIVIRRKLMDILGIWLNRSLDSDRERPHII